MTRALAPGGQLTELDLAVLQHAAHGLTIAATARAIGKSAVAVQDARHRLMGKLGATTLVHAVFLACQAGILDGRPRRHGDHAGYEAHRRRGEDPSQCQPCREGERAHRRAMKKRDNANQEAA